MAIDYTFNPGEPQATPETTEPTSSWYSNFDPSIQEFVKARGWDNPDGPLQALNSLKTLESLKGAPADRLLQIPEKPEDWAAVYQRLGRPEAPDKYAYKLPEGIEAEESVWNDTYQEFSKLAYENGLNNNQLKSLLDYAVTREQRVSSAYNETQEREQQRQQAALAKEWGSEFETKKGLATQALTKLGLTGDFVENLTTDLGSKVNTLKLLSHIGGFMQESNVHPGFSGTAPQTQASRENGFKEELKAILIDGFQNGGSAFQVGDDSRWQKINQLAVENARWELGNDAFKGLK